MAGPVFRVGRSLLLGSASPSACRGGSYRRSSTCSRHSEPSLCVHPIRGRTPVVTPHVLGRGLGKSGLARGEGVESDLRRRRRRPRARGRPRPSRWCASRDPAKKTGFFVFPFFSFPCLLHPTTAHRLPLLPPPSPPGGVGNAPIADQIQRHGQQPVGQAPCAVPHAPRPPPPSSGRETPLNGRTHGWPHRSAAGPSWWGWAPSRPRQPGRKKKKQRRRRGGGRHSGCGTGRRHTSATSTRNRGAPWWDPIHFLLSAPPLTWVARRPFGILGRPIAWQVSQADRPRTHRSIPQTCRLVKRRWGGACNGRPL